LIESAPNRNTVAGDREPRHLRIEEWGKPLFRGRNKITFVVQIVVSVGQKLVCVAKLWVGDFCAFEVLNVCFLRLLKFKPFLFRGAAFESSLEGQKPFPDGRVVVNLDPVLGNVDQPKAARFSPPAFQVFAFEEGLQQISRFRVLGAEVFLGGPIGRFVRRITLSENIGRS
jgi:hypothetical protein